MNFSQRSKAKELLDRDDIPFADIRQNMKELDFINTWLGGHKITIDGLKHLILSKPLEHKKELVICEIGCGGGDNLLAIHAWCRKNSVKVSFIGIDINPDCIRVAKKRLSSSPVQFITADYKYAPVQEMRPDIIFTSLFCHHFTEEELVGMLQWMQSNARMGYFINDLHRHPLAYYSIKMLTRFFSGSYMVKNDAPLSVLRGFKVFEWKELLKAAGISNYIIQWKWAFRHLVIVDSTPAHPFNSLPE